MNVASAFVPTVTLASASAARACLESCRKIAARLAQVKQRLLDQFSGRLGFDGEGTEPRQLHLALNEAEALAWQTGVPQLVFPTLALEKAQAVVAWNARQRFLLERGASESAWRDTLLLH